MTELIWDGKYVDGKRQTPVRVALPFQTIETVNESAADRNRTLELFASGRPTDWRNRLIWGDNKYVIPALVAEFGGRIDLIYIDPPFTSGQDFSYTASIPSHDGDTGEQTEFLKEPSIIEQKAYRDTWGKGIDSFIGLMSERLTLMRELLTEHGTIYVHCDWRVNSYIRLLLDEVFGKDQFLNEIVWRRRTNTVKAISKSFSTNTDTIFIFTKSKDNYRFNIQYGEYPEEYMERFKYEDERGKYRWQVMATYSAERYEELKKQNRLRQSETAKYPEFKQYVWELKGRPIENIWDDINMINAMGGERLGYDTQKPEALLERIIKASSNEGDIVADFFCGSGTTGAVAEKLGRRWILCDISRFAIHTTRKRLLSIPGVTPYAVQNLGKYERQAWQSAEFSGTGDSDALDQQRLREAAYRKFILDLYHATPVSGSAWLHGMKSSRMVHVGAVDAPITLADVRAIAREVWKTSSGSGESKKAAADILGWDFAFEMNETAKQIAAESRVDVVFKRIPREVLEKKAVEQGDIKFFELGALSVDAKQKKRELNLELTDFIIPIDDVPEEARKSIKHWAQIIDYWAVDWDFKYDTFHNQWQSYRTRQDPKLELKAKFEYAEAGDYKVVVKVIDILGNDTTKTLDIKVR
jgi:DNA modification methylase